jgi:hypothetical protein
MFALFPTINGSIIQPFKKTLFFLLKTAIIFCNIILQAPFYFDFLYENRTQKMPIRHYGVPVNGLWASFLGSESI